MRLSRHAAAPDPSLDATLQELETELSRLTERAQQRTFRRARRKAAIATMKALS